MGQTLRKARDRVWPSFSREANSSSVSRWAQFGGGTVLGVIRRKATLRQGQGLGWERVRDWNRVWAQARTGRRRLAGCQGEETSKMRGPCLVKKGGTKMLGSEGAG